MPLPGTYPVEGTGDKLTVDDLTAFLKAALPKSGQNAFTVRSGGAEGVHGDTRFSIESKENWLVSITDVDF